MDRPDKWRNTMYTLHNVGDQALLVEFENEISMEVNRKVMALSLIHI